jgi:purine-nucleoside/S-methyl-5'-thioadenosine phosphorylase / adenosine deaminase
MTLGVPRDEVPGFAELGLVAFTTLRAAGDFGVAGRGAVADVLGRWWGLLEELAPITDRLATSHQVHGTQIDVHDGDWHGWLRGPRADGHASFARSTAMAVTLADCVPIFIGHPSGAAALLHSGWRGTAGSIVRRGVAEFRSRGLAPQDLTVHLGPAICARCYEVGPDVYASLTGKRVERPTPVDLRAIIARHARDAGVHRITVADSCTKCSNARFYSHRAGDAGRQLAVLASHVAAPGGFLDSLAGDL